MRAFRLTPDNAIIFWELVQELNADTEEKRVAILDAMAEFGQIDSIVQTPMTKEEYINHLNKHFKVLDIKSMSNKDTSKEP